MPVTNPHALLQIFNKEEWQEWIPYLHKALCTWRRIIYKNCHYAFKLIKVKMKCGFTEVYTAALTHSYKIHVKLINLTVFEDPFFVF
jgi:hypothetical protein